MMGKVMNTQIANSSSEPHAAVPAILTGGDRWLPELTLGTKVVTRNGSYDPEDDGYDAYSRVVVMQMHGGAVIGTEGGTGDVVVYGEGERREVGSLRLHVDSPPYKTAYDVGERIDYTGLRVSLRNPDGSRYRDARYPDGSIPFGELILPMEYARAECMVGSQALYDDAFWAYVEEVEASRIRPMPSEGIQGLRDLFGTLTGECGSAFVITRLHVGDRFECSTETSGRLDDGMYGDDEEFRGAATAWAEVRELPRYVGGAEVPTYLVYPTVMWAELDEYSRDVGRLPMVPFVRQSDVSRDAQDERFVPDETESVTIGVGRRDVWIEYLYDGEWRRDEEQDGDADHSCAVYMMEPSWLGSARFDDVPPALSPYALPSIASDEDVARASSWLVGGDITQSGDHEPIGFPREFHDSSAWMEYKGTRYDFPNLDAIYWDGYDSALMRMFSIAMDYFIFYGADISPTVPVMWRNPYTGRTLLTSFPISVKS